MGYRISVDTGGTFTDVIVADEAGGQTVGKSLTTPDRIWNGMKGAMENAADLLGVEFSGLLRDTEIVIYGTTRSTNAIVQNKVAKTALLTTEGFPDVLVLKEGGKFRPHDLNMVYPEPYIPRSHTFEITERVSSESDVTVPLDKTQARQILETLKRRNFEAVAVCFLWSIANPENELAIAALLDEILPGVPYTLSHQLVPIIREYRRASATAIDASLKPLMQEHLREMNGDLRDAGYEGEILVSTSVGGCLHVDELIERPIHTVKCGPAMAPVAGLTYAEMENLGRDVIICDTGGTTFDVGLVRDGQLKFTRETWLGGQYTGHLLGISSVDVRSIGAGGGSIAWIDSGGLMRVGPHSAGADPGPACYGKGGDQPTVTDAATVLGYMDPDFFLGGNAAGDASLTDRITMPSAPLAARSAWIPKN
ncbi:MAG: hydantoinase/oxoprolinase family protein, partial [Rhodospirillales bacterium]|nr:hydantoinase/oxoprolinase family protein [Rhodospirillales bacterium]